MNMINNLNLQKYLPEPKNTLSETAGKLGGIAASVLGNLTSTGLSGSSVSDLLQSQSETQLKLLEISMQSNLMRIDHETKMSVIRNLRGA